MREDRGPQIFLQGWTAGGDTKRRERRGRRDRVGDLRGGTRELFSGGLARPFRYQVSGIKCQKPDREGGLS
jgi:hypothetical protein